MYLQRFSKSAMKFLSKGLVLGGLALPWSALASSGGIGGYMSNCYAGNGFNIETVCEESSPNYNVYSANGNPIKILAHATARYLSKNGGEVGVQLNLKIDDSNNFFNPEIGLPVIVRTFICGFHRNLDCRMQSHSLVLSRDYGTKVFRGSVSVPNLRNNFGAEYVELLNRIEVLVPGVAEMPTLNF